MVNTCRFFFCFAGSGKTIAAELAMFKVFRDYPGAKVVYIAPLKALVRERMADWTVRLGGESTMGNLQFDRKVVTVVVTL